MMMALMEHLNPLVNVVKRVMKGEIEDKNRTMCISQIGWDKAPELLLPGCIPELQAVRSVLVPYILRQVIDSDCMLPTLSNSYLKSFLVQVTLDKPLDYG